VIGALTVLGAISSPAQAATLDTAAYCPAGGVINSANISGLKRPNSTAAETAEGASLVATSRASGSQNYSYSSFEYFSPSKNQYSIHDTWANNNGFNGIGEVRSYDFASNKRYLRYSGGAANPVQRKAVRLLAKSTVWTSETSPSTKTVTLQQQLNSNLGNVSYVDRYLADGAGTVTCTTTPTSVTYNFTFTTGESSASTVTLRDDGAPLTLHQVYTAKGGGFTETQDTTITYGDAAGALIMPAAGTSFTPLNTWRSAYLKAGLLALKSDELGWAKYYVSKAKTKAARIAAIRKGARKNIANRANYYFWYASWVPAIHVKNVTGGAKVWATDPKTHKQLWFTMKLKGTKAIAVTKNFP
jgi:hypothetical protein